MTHLGMFGIVCGAALFAGSAFAQSLPKASEIYPKMGLGWNLGNTMEVPETQGGPKGWGNDVPTQEIIDSVKAAGFTTIRIPCAWNSHASNGTISAEWLATVKSVVDMAIKKDMYVILNSHWDEGWLEDEVFSGTHPDRNNLIVTTDSSEIRKLQENYWKQIADYFKDYDEHLLFASANEPGVNDPRISEDNNYKSLSEEYKVQFTDNGQFAFTKERMVILKRLHEACLRAVRTSGGNNATRTVIVQTPRTEIEKYPLLADDYPEDPAGKGYTMAEVHFYPYQFSLMTEDADWGKTLWYWEDVTTGNSDRTCTGSSLGSKQSIENQFKKLQATFADEGIPVVIGEMGANKRYSLKGTEGFDLDKHLEAIAAWYGYTVASAKSHGIVPIIWDTGYEGEGTANNMDHMTIIRREDKYGSDLGKVVDQLTMNAIKTQFAAAKAYEGPKEGPAISESDKALWVTYTSKKASEQETGTVRINLSGEDWSSYNAISFDIRTEGAYKPLTGEEYGWASFALFSMSGADWDNSWAETKIGDVTSLGGTLSNVKVEFGSAEGQLNLVDITNVNAIGINVYATQFNGSIYLNNILLHKADGSIDTLASFDTAPAKLETAGTASKPTYIQANAKGTGPANPTTAIPVSATVASKMIVNVHPGMVTASFTASKAAPAKVMLMNPLGQVISQQNFNASKGMNRVELENNYRGPAMLIVKQGNQRYMQKVILK